MPGRTLFSVVDSACFHGAAAPTRRGELGHLLTSWSELVWVADSFDRNGRSGPQGTQVACIP